MYVPLLVNRFQKCILLIVQYRYSKSCSGDFILQNLILRTRSCGTDFITQSSWVFHFHLTTIVRWKCFAPPLYQFRRGILGGPALKYFYMIHRCGRLWYHICPSVTIHVQRTATYCNALQRTATHCNTLQATHCNTMQRAVHTLQHTMHHTAPHCIIAAAQHTATHCMLQHAAACCTLQNFATHCTRCNTPACQVTRPVL